MGSFQARGQARHWRNEGNKLLAGETPPPIPTQGLALNSRTLPSLSRRNKYNSIELNSKTITDGLGALDEGISGRCFTTQVSSPTNKELHSTFSWKDKTPNTGFCSRHRSKRRWDCALRFTPSEGPAPPRSPRPHRAGGSPAGSKWQMRPGRRSKEEDFPIYLRPIHLENQRCSHFKAHKIRWKPR